MGERHVLPGQELVDAPEVDLRVADITDSVRFGQILKDVQPDVVFHAAAFKHVPLMQANPLEAINNNIWGTLNVLRQSIEHGVRNVVYVSTDKAVNPVNVMGQPSGLAR